MTIRQTRAERAASPLARDSIRTIAESVGGCLRPVQLRRTDQETGAVEQVMKPCGATLASICPPCAQRAKQLREVQCREGWHLEAEPDLSPAAPDEMQEYWLILRAEAQVQRDRAEARGEDTGELDALIEELDIEVTRSGVRGTVTTSPRNSTGGGTGGKAKTRRVRSTRRRQDAPDLPKRTIAPTTLGKLRLVFWAARATVVSSRAWRGLHAACRPRVHPAFQRRAHGPVWCLRARLAAPGKRKADRS